MEIPPDTLLVEPLRERMRFMGTHMPAVPLNAADEEMQRYAAKMVRHDVDAEPKANQMKSGMTGRARVAASAVLAVMATTPWLAN